MILHDRCIAVQGFSFVLRDISALRSSNAANFDPGRFPPERVGDQTWVLVLGPTPCPNTSTRLTLQRVGYREEFPRLKPHAAAALGGKNGSVAETLVYPNLGALRPPTNLRIL